MGPLRLRLFSPSHRPLPTTVGAAMPDDDGSSYSAGGGGAKVAFMITSSMKQELKDKLGYDADQIKQMTPQQASIVLYHAVSPDTFDGRLPILEEEFAMEQEEKQRQQEQDRALKLQQEQEEERVRFESFSGPQILSLSSSPSSSSAAAAASIAGESHAGNSTTSSSQLARSESKDYNESSLVGHILDSKTETDAATASSTEPTTGTPEVLFDSSETPVMIKGGGRHNGFADVWYEVVEVNPNGERLRVGLYQDREEALLGLETREMIRDKRLERASPLDPRNTFDIRQISKEEALLGRS